MRFIKNVAKFFLKKYQTLDGNIKIKNRYKKKKKDGLIKVVFVCQFLPSWEKTKWLYLRMLSDKRFSPFVLCVPSNYNASINDTFDVLQEQGYSNLINSICDSKKFVSLSSLKCDYIFYDRPYNVYLPKEYRAHNAAKYGKICLHSYGICLSKKLHRELLYHDFLSYVSVYFSDSEEALDYYKKTFVKASKYKKAEYLGYLGLENVLLQHDFKTNIWDSFDDKTRVLWAPRWSIDSFSGGSNFFKFKDSILNLSDKHRLGLIIRPHPLMFENFKNAGLMSEKDISDFKEKVFERKAIIDVSNNYIPTFWETDILIADFSSIIIEFVLTGKPIIYCASSIEWELFNFAKDLISCCYIANSLEDLDDFVYKIKAGQDYLKEKRLAFIKKYMGVSKELPSEKMCSFFSKNYLRKDE